jgi:hypothetical protein
MAKEPPRLDDKPGHPGASPEAVASRWDTSGIIIFDEDGNVVYDQQAQTMGIPAFKTRAEWQAAQDQLQQQLADYRRRRDAGEVDIDYPPDEDLEPPEAE